VGEIRGGQASIAWSALTMMPFEERTGAPSRVTTYGCMRCSPGTPDMMNDQSLPAAENRSCIA